jgi:hypothetical protein
MDTHFLDYRANRWCAGIYRDSRRGCGDCTHPICSLSHSIFGLINPAINERMIQNTKANTNKIMNRAIGLALLAAGIALIVYGIDASNSASSSLSRTFNGTPTNKTLWLLIGGIAASICGAVLTFKPSRR